MELEHYIPTTKEELQRLIDELSGFLEDEVPVPLEVLLDSGITNRPHVVRFEVVCSSCYGRGYVPKNGPDGADDDSEPCQDCAK